MHAATHYVERYEVHDGNDGTVDDVFGTNFGAADSAFTSRLDRVRAAGQDPGQVKLVAVLASGE